MLATINFPFFFLTFKIYDWASRRPGFRPSLKAEAKITVSLSSAYTERLSQKEKHASVNKECIYSSEPDDH